jgi:hypothetical protein
MQAADMTYIVVWAGENFQLPAQLPADTPHMRSKPRVIALAQRLA